MFFRALYKNLQTAFRMLKNIVIRPVNLIQSRVTNLFNAKSVSKFTSKVQKAFSNFIKNMKLKPTERSDFLDVGTVFVAKSVIIVLLILIFALVSLVYFILWPWFATNFLTARFYQGEKSISTYTGKAIIYYDKAYKNVLFKGRLSKGAYTSQGKLYYKNGNLEYDGAFSDDEYDGDGTSYSNDEKQIYTGQYKAGKYSGQGTLNLDNGTVYKGGFSDNQENGTGDIYKGKTLIFDGNIKDGMESGSGTDYYDDGSLQYVGNYATNLFDGAGKEYYDKTGNLEFDGSFSAGKYKGSGTLYDSSGNLLYTGLFVDGLYDGNGKLTIIKDQSWYEGAFTQGKKDGSGKLYKNSQLYYDGSFADDVMSGAGKLTDTVSGVEFDGNFADNDIDYGSLFSQTLSKVYPMFKSGMTQDTSKTDACYYYNATYGALLKISYATSSTSAALTDAYTLPMNSPIQKITKTDDLKLPGTYKIGSSGNAVPDKTVCNYLSVACKTMKVYHLLFSTYTVTYYVDPSSGSVELIQYVAATNKLNSTTASKQNSIATTAAFKSLGLDLSDFKSLGY
jgi:hypothetical protein